MDCVVLNPDWILIKYAFIGIKNIIVLVRQQDVRATEIDKVDMHDSFRAGDIVRAVVVSLRPVWLVLLNGGNGDD